VPTVSSDLNLKRSMVLFHRLFRTPCRRRRELDRRSPRKWMCLATGISIQANRDRQRYNTYAVGSRSFTKVGTHAFLLTRRWYPYRKIDGIGSPQTVLISWPLQLDPWTFDPILPCRKPSGKSSSTSQCRCLAFHSCTSAPCTTLFSLPTMRIENSKLGPDHVSRS
jgi:hypothetical protein